MAKLACKRTFTFAHTQSSTTVFFVFVYMHQYCLYTLHYVWCSTVDDTVVQEFRAECVSLHIQQWNTANIISLTQAFKMHWIIKDTFDSFHSMWVEGGMDYSSLFLFLHKYPGQSTLAQRIR